MDPLRDSLLVLIGVAGFMLALYIYRKKRVGAPLVCPLRASCDLVTHSTYSKIFGIPVELLGMVYYAFVALSHGFALASFTVIPHVLIIGMLAVSAFAFLFSMYLVSIQAFVLKQWCTWCLISASFCVLIFVITLAGTPGLF